MDQANTVKTKQENEALVGCKSITELSYRNDLQNKVYQRQTLLSCAISMNLDVKKLIADVSDETDPEKIFSSDLVLLNLVEVY